MITFLLALLFVILNILDVRTTRKALSQGGYEANPLARLLMRLHLFIPAKVLMVVVILGVMLLLDQETAIKIGVICCCIYSLIVWNNYRTLRLQARERCQE